jgi:hypothetical protein
VALLGLAACEESEPPPIAPRPEHPLNAVESVATLEAALERYPQMERQDTDLFGTVWIAGPLGAVVRTERGYEGGWLVEAPFTEITVEFPDRTHRLHTRSAGNGTLWIDGQLHAGWGFALTVDHGLATFPFGNPWVRFGRESGLDPEGSAESPPRRWAEATRR